MDYAVGEAEKKGVERGRKEGKKEMTLKLKIKGIPYGEIAELTDNHRRN